MNNFDCILTLSNKIPMTLSAGILAKVKEGAENVHTRLQAKAESVGFKNVGSELKGEYSTTTC